MIAKLEPTMELDGHYEDGTPRFRGPRKPRWVVYEGERRLVRTIERREGKRTREHHSVAGEQGRKLAEHRRRSVALKLAAAA